MNRFFLRLFKAWLLRMHQTLNQWIHSGDFFVDNCPDWWTWWCFHSIWLMDCRFSIGMPLIHHSKPQLIGINWNNSIVTITAHSDAASILDCLIVCLIVVFLTWNFRFFAWLGVFVRNLHVRWRWPARFTDDKAPPRADLQWFQGRPLLFFALVTCSTWQLFCRIVVLRLVRTKLHRKKNLKFGHN